jgi:hypothetical protein
MRDMRILSRGVARVGWGGLGWSLPVPPTIGPRQCIRAPSNPRRTVLTFQQNEERR